MLPTAPKIGRTGRSLPGWVVVGALALAGIVVGALVTGSLRAPADERPGEPAVASGVGNGAIGAYLEVVEPLSRQGGMVVQQGLKPAVLQLGLDTSDGFAVTVEGARGWLASLTEVRERWAATPHPPGLEDAHATFLVALDGYLEAARHIVDALQAADADQLAVAERAVVAGEAADDRWDEAARAIQTALVDTGGEPVPWLPQP